jgi:hypothetical protein
MNRTYDGPAQMVLPRITNPDAFSGYADHSRFLLVTNRGTDMKILSLQWQVNRVKRFFFVEGTGALLPVDDYTEEKLKKESMYLLAGIRTQN